MRGHWRSSATGTRASVNVMNLSRRTVATENPRADVDWVSGAVTGQARDAEYQVDIGIPARISREWIRASDQRQESARTAYRITRAGRLVCEDDLNANLFSIGDYGDNLRGS